MDNDIQFSGQVRAVAKEPPFPRNVIIWRNYTGLRVIALILLAVATLGLARTMITTTFGKKNIVAHVESARVHRGWIKKAWEWCRDWAWQGAPEGDKIQEGIENTIARKRLWSCVRLTVTWFLVWLCFDWDKARHFAFAACAIGFGVVYSIMPVDAIPDTVPFAGVLDDLSVNLFGSGIGIASILEYYRGKKHKAVVARMIQENPANALNLVLEEYHLELVETQKPSS